MQEVRGPDSKGQPGLVQRRRRCSPCFPASSCPARRQPAARPRPTSRGPQEHRKAGGLVRHSATPREAVTTQKCVLSHERSPTGRGPVAKWGAALQEPQLPVPPGHTGARRAPLTPLSARCGATRLVRTRGLSSLEAARDLGSRPPLRPLLPLGVHPNGGVWSQWKATQLETSQNTLRGGDNLIREPSV